MYTVLCRSGEILFSKCYSTIEVAREAYDMILEGVKVEGLCPVGLEIDEVFVFGGVIILNSECK